MTSQIDLKFLHSNESLPFQQWIVKFLEVSSENTMAILINYMKAGIKRYQEMLA